MNWTQLVSIEQLESISKESQNHPVIIFKHSTRCSISKTSLARLERNWQAGDLPEVPLYFLDLLTYRDISNAIAQTFQVVHESPQILIIKNGQSIYDKSHFDIDFSSIKTVVKNLSEEKTRV